jgi:transposase-like protein
MKKTKAPQPEFLPNPETEIVDLTGPDDERSTALRPGVLGRGFALVTKSKPHATHVGSAGGTVHVDSAGGAGAVRGLKVKRARRSSGVVAVEVEYDGEDSESESSSSSERPAGQERKNKSGEAYSVDFKVDVLKCYYEMGQSYQRVAQEKNCTPSLVFRIVQLCKDIDDKNDLPRIRKALKPHRRGGDRRSKLRDEDLQRLFRTIDEHPEYYLHDLCKFTREELGINVSLTTVRRAVVRYREQKAKSC